MNLWPITSWDAAMLALLPLLRGHQMARTWAALGGASLATFFVHDPVGYIVIDAIAAALVLRDPAGLPQKAIARLFVLMIFFEIGFAFFSPRASWETFTAILTWIGWAQWAILAGWFGGERFRHYQTWDRAADRPPPAAQRHHP